MPKIILVGYMASGKTSVARELGRLTGYRVVDLDHYIEEKKGRPIGDIFAHEGEVRFREFESLMLDEVLAQPDDKSGRRNTVLCGQPSQTFGPRANFFFFADFGS